MSESVTVEVTEGTLRGKKTSSKSGGTYYSFRGVPFAKPPIGPLRFRPAEPPEPWSGIREAYEEGGCCTQYNDDEERWEGSEDCLYLNVYTPQLSGRNLEEPLKPVMVFIHGGAFVSGSASTDKVGPDFLVDEGVVVVTPNYRLSVLGFLCLNLPSAPGNVGLKDQVAALRWVQKNIAKFGGDPNQVTLFGQSAGAGSVHYHTLSPMSKGLFCRVIAQSGCALNPWALEYHPIEMAFRLGEALGFEGSRPEQLVDYLRGIDHVTLVKAAVDHGLSEEAKERLIQIPFLTTLEVDLECVERFLPGHPQDLVDEGRHCDVSYMTGVTSLEGILLAKYRDFNDPETITTIERDFNKLIAPELRLPLDHRDRDQIVNKLRNYFLGDKPFNRDTLLGFFEMCSDLLFTEGIHYVVKKLVRNKKSPVYLYQFSHEGKLNYMKPSLTVNYPGACHADDLGCIFRIREIDFDLDPESEDAITRARMVRMWTNFAKTGKPTVEEDPLLPVTWKPCTADNLCYLDIGEELVLTRNMFQKRLEFWEELYSDIVLNGAKS